MTLAQQMLWGSLFLGISLILQVGILAAGAVFLNALALRIKSRAMMLRFMVLPITGLGFIVVAHMAQVWLWARVFVLNNVLDDWNSAVYFSLVTYTSLGYGDIVLGAGLRIFAAFAAVTGLLGFGMSTAYLVALMSRLFSGLVR